MGSVTLTLAGNTLVLNGTVNNVGNKWLPGGQLHALHAHQYSDISGGSCANIGPHFDLSTDPHGSPIAPAGSRHDGDFGSFSTDVNANLPVALTLTTTLTDLNEFIGRSMAVTKNVDDNGLGGNAQSLVDGNSGPIVACCVIVDNNGGVVTEYAPPVTTPAAWTNPWPQQWVAPPGCAYIPIGYVAPTTTTTTTTAYYGTTTTTTTTAATTVYYGGVAPTTAAPTTAAATGAWCWNCPLQSSSGAAPPYTAYTYGPCVTSSTGVACVSSSTVKCSASGRVLALVAAVVAVLALLI
jgi:Cu/Zn superoxide dismutase